VASTDRSAAPAKQLEDQRAELHGAFGRDAFGRLAEKAAGFFGTPQYIVGQTVAVLAWVVLNSTQLHLGFAWDVYPFIALNLLFSLQAAYAAPLILLAQTRQADRDKIHSDRIDKSHSRLERASKRENDKLLELLQSNTDLTLQDKELTAGRGSDRADPRPPHEAARELSPKEPRRAGQTCLERVEAKAIGDPLLVGFAPSWLDHGRRPRELLRWVFLTGVRTSVREFAGLGLHTLPPSTRSRERHRSALGRQARARRADRARLRRLRAPTSIAAEGSVSGSGTTRAPQAQHVRQAAADEVNGPADAPGPRGIRRRREWAREVLDVHEVRANGSDSLKVL
jgi:uncharacterized membrane protein